MHGRVVVTVALAVALLAAAACRGPEGSQGQQGPTGRTGPAPTRAELTALISQVLAGRDAVQPGAASPLGTQGVPGTQGPMGPVGPDGAPGADGPAGLTGPGGPQGAQGPTGPEGTQAERGPQGEDGLPGPQGPQGVQGLAGDAGAVGPPGPSVPDQTIAVAVNSPVLGYPISTGPRLGTNPPWLGWTAWRSLQSVTLALPRSGWVFVIATGQSEQSSPGSLPASVGLGLAPGPKPDVAVDIWARTGETVMQPYTVSRSYYFEAGLTQTFYLLAAGIDVIIRPGSLTAIFIPDPR